MVYLKKFNENIAIDIFGYITTSAIVMGLGFAFMVMKDSVINFMISDLYNKRLKKIIKQINKITKKYDAEPEVQDILNSLKIEPHRTKEFYIEKAEKLKQYIIKNCSEQEKEELEFLLFTIENIIEKYQKNEK